MAISLKERILTTASNLFYDQGIHATGVDAIVKAAGTTKMSLYKYYSSKDDLVLAHLSRSGTEIFGRINDGINNRTVQPAQKLLAVFDVFSEILSDEKFRGCPFINASAEYSGTNNPVLQASAEFYQQFRKLLTDIAKQALLDNPEELANQLTLLIAGSVVTEQMKQNSGAMLSAKRAAERLIANSAN